MSLFIDEYCSSEGTGQYCSSGKKLFLWLLMISNVAELWQSSLVGQKSTCNRVCRREYSFAVSVRPRSITSLKCVLTQEHLDAICAKYFVPEEVHPQLPSPDSTMHERPAGKVGMYTRFFDYAKYRILFSTFFVSVLTHFRIPFSQLSVFGSAKVSHFEIMCRVCNIEPSVSLFRYFYTHNYKNGWFGFTKCPNVRASYSKNLDSVKNWNDYFFWVDEFVVRANARFSWFSGSNIVKDRAPAPSEYNVEHVNTLIAQASPFLRFPEEFLCWLTPVKVRIVERARGENERLIVTVAKHRTVTLLPTSVVRSSGELSASVEREFVGDASVGDGGDQGVLIPFGGQKKRVIRGSERTPAASHPPKRLRADYGATGGSATGAHLWRWARDHTALLSAWSLLCECRSSARSDVPVMTEVTIVATIATTVAIPANVGKDKSAPHQFIFCSSSSSEKTDRTLSLFNGKVSKVFCCGSIRAEEVLVLVWRNLCSEWTLSRGMENEQLFNGILVSAARNLSLSSEVRMRAEYNILEKRKWKSLDEEKDSQLRARVSGLEATEGSLRGEVHELESSSTDLREKLEMYVGSLKRLDEFQDNLMRPLDTRLAEIDTDFTRCCMRFQESFHPHLLNVVAGRRWLLTHGMKLLMAKCLNSTEYMEVLGHAFGRAI
ncbi:hypothetical protein Tco_0464421 [Tanacetum coccineum]